MGLHEPRCLAPDDVSIDCCSAAQAAADNRIREWIASRSLRNMTSSFVSDLILRYRLNIKSKHEKLAFQEENLRFK